MYTPTLAPKPFTQNSTAALERITREAFIQREVMLWGQSEIDRMLDNGYIVIRSQNAPGWTWASRN
jgi:hypothetical protein